MIILKNFKETPNDFGGSELKKTIIYNGNRYMVKFPDPARKKDAGLKYINNVFSEEIGCKIFSSIGIETQETFLAKFYLGEKEKIVVVCKDFRPKNTRLIEAGTMGLSNVESGKKMTHAIEDVEDFISLLKTTEENKKLFSEKFWDIFVVDTLLGNEDRHLGNWGFLLDEQDNHKFAPVYDCGSTLAPLNNDVQLENWIKNDTDFKNQVLNIYPPYTYKEKRIPYFQFYRENIENLNNAVLRIVPKINLEKINSIIDNTEEVSEIRKQFLKKSIEYRYRNILLLVYKKLQKISLLEKPNFNNTKTRKSSQMPEQVKKNNKDNLLHL